MGVNEATDREMRGAVEQWAKVRGWWRGGGWFESHGHPWDVAARPDGLVWIGGRRPYTEHKVSPHAAIVWALSVELAGESTARLVLDSQPRPVSPADVWLREAMVDVAKPPRSGRTTRMIEAAKVVSLSRRTAFVVGSPVDMRFVQSRSQCHRVTAPGSDRGPVNWLVVLPAHALDRFRDFEHVFVDHYAIESALRPDRRAIAETVARINGVQPGADHADRRTIEALLVLSDRLQPDLLRRADGPPRQLEREALGIHIAMLLAGKRDGTADAVALLMDRSARHPGSS